MTDTHLIYKHVKKTVSINYKEETINKRIDELCGGGFVYANEKTQKEVTLEERMEEIREIFARGLIQ